MKAMYVFFPLEEKKTFGWVLTIEFWKFGNVNHILFSETLYFIIGVENLYTLKIKKIIL